MFGPYSISLVFTEVLYSDCGHLYMTDKSGHEDGIGSDRSSEEIMTVYRAIEHVLLCTVKCVSKQPDLLF